MHDLWLSEGYSSAVFNATQAATYPVARDVASNIRNRSEYQLGFGDLLGQRTSVPLLVKVCNQNLLPDGNDTVFDAREADIKEHWRQVRGRPLHPGYV